MILLILSHLLLLSSHLTYFSSHILPLSPPLPLTSTSSPLAVPHLLHPYACLVQGEEIAYKLSEVYAPELRDGSRGRMREEIKEMLVVVEDTS
jgi:hypothetical protein